MQKDRCAVEAGGYASWSHAVNSINGFSALGRVWGQSGDGSAALLARLEAENAKLRYRAAELALDIQKLAEKSA